VRVKYRSVLIGAIIFFTALWGNAALASPGSVTAIDTNDRLAVIQSYQQRLEPLLAVPVGWTGTVKGCKAGTTSLANRRATVAAVNYVRSLAKLKSVSLNRSMSKKAQDAALIMAANNYLTHNPPKSASCWTKSGYDGASHSNLFLGWSSHMADPNYLSDATGARAVIGYMDDDGDNNTVVGHRRWIMFQQLTTIGTGDTDFTNSLYVVSRDRRPSQNIWVSWPTAGYFPQELEPRGRWSLSYPGADFSRAKVTVTAGSNPIKVMKQYVRNGYADNTISWDMRLPGEYAPQPDMWISDDSNEPQEVVVLPDLAVRVVVSGIRLNGKNVSKRWTTTLVQASARAIP
jgi:uncharacterized protein YkwD